MVCDQFCDNGICKECFIDYDCPGSNRCENDYCVNCIDNNDCRCNSNCNSVCKFIENSLGNLVKDCINNTNILNCNGTYCLNDTCVECIKDNNCNDNHCAEKKSMQRVL